MEVCRMDEKHKEVYKTHIEGKESASEAVLRAVTTASNQPILDLPPLANSIDPDSLDQLFASSPAPDLLQFRYEAYLITVEPGHVRIQTD